MKKPLYTKVLQIGFVVRDCEKTAKVYVDKYGIGPWEIYGPDCLKDVTQYGKPCPMQIKVASCFMGDVELELIEPLDDISMYADFLKEHGEGMHHLAMESDFGRAMEFCKEKDIPVTLAGEFGTGEFYAYMDDSKETKCIVELYDSHPGSSYPDPIKVIEA